MESLVDNLLDTLKFFFGCAFYKRHGVAMDGLKLRILLTISLRICKGFA